MPTSHDDRDLSPGEHEALIRRADAAILEGRGVRDEARALTRANERSGWAARAASFRPPGPVPVLGWLRRGPTDM